MDLRAAQYERAYSRFTDGPHRDDRSAIIAESSRLRSVAWTAYYRFKLTSPREDLNRLAERAVQDALDVADAADKADLKKRSELARKGIDDFACVAAAQLAGTVPVQDTAANRPPAQTASPPDVA